MNSLFEPTTADEIFERLNNVSSTTIPKWGKMNAAQMVTHCQSTFDVFFSEKKMRRSLAGILFGKMARKKLLTNDPWPRNLPTAREFIVADERDFEIEKARLVELIHRFCTEGYTITEFRHPFFGKFSSQEWALFAYKHMDHHLTQFGA